MNRINNTNLKTSSEQKTGIPLFYNLAVGTTKETLVSESSILTSYDDGANCFYVTVPKNSVVDLKQIEKINTESIEEIVIEEAR